MEIEEAEFVEQVKYRFQCTKQLKDLRYNTDGYETTTTKDQQLVEEKVLDKYILANEGLKFNIQTTQLDRTKHIEFIKSGLFRQLDISALDASRSWVIYWCVHSLCLLRGDNYTQEERDRILSTYSTFQHPDGGFSGGPNQQAHLAPTYAAVNALILLKGPDSYDIINRKKLRNFLLAMKKENGSYILHQSGEVDVRGVYCAISSASLCGLLPDEQLTSNTADWVISCQTYEGGFGAKPGCEAHGGYTFCGIATLTLLGQLQRCNMKSLLRWSINRQLPMEGGFSGRTNKLVDGCYSFWCGALLPIIQAHLTSLSETKTALPDDKWLFNQQALQEYILCCCQSAKGGLIDKPGKNPDFYHTCYTLSGLSIAQNSPKLFILPESVEIELPTIHPIYNLEMSVVEMAKNYFQSKSI